MMSYLFYLSFKPAAGTQTVWLPGHRPMRPGFIRVEAFKGLSAEAALDRARPKKGEIVLNTVEAQS